MHDFHMSPDVLVFHQLFLHTVKLTQLRSSVSLFAETVNHVDFVKIFPNGLSVRGSLCFSFFFYYPHYKICKRWFGMASNEEG